LGDAEAPVVSLAAALFVGGGGRSLLVQSKEEPAQNKARRFEFVQMTWLRLWIISSPV